MDKYIITTAQRGGLPNWDFLRGLETYAKHNGAEILILPTNGMYPSSTKADQEEVLHPYISSNFRVIEGDHSLNGNLDIRFFPVKAQQMDPTTSWDRFVAYDKSAIMPSPKQRMRVVPTSNSSLPKVLMSTGAITQPHYKDNSWGTKAALDHVYGAIIAEILSGNMFDFTQLKASKNGVFYDRGYKYSKHHKVRKERLDAVVWGDIHCHQRNRETIEWAKEKTAGYNPKYLMIHDLFDGYSINHHDINMLAYRAAKSREGGLSLEDELAEAGEFLADIRLALPDTKIIIVKSNHDEVIDRYLESGRFVEDPQNVDIALKMFQAMRESKDPLQEGIRSMYGRVPGVKFLSRDDDFKVRGYQLANHFDLGLNGARGSVRSAEKSNGKSMGGHPHTPEIFREVYAVGMFGDLKMNYNRGPSSWMHTMGLIPANGKPQLINYIPCDL